ncbi:BglG family transcription antiterminator [Streptococcus sciuri]|uniref:BglG family transcription antiterminator n=1 Tax=Streptococcus sciuri TaxID=2973939 RepID=A0ABT2F773_9STRE|nr:BglG family transcription antiterminator [Streptococcus sciuri]MCS4488341.1 BglG family transcription antiterminator [Streptococcus sciuri]
MLHPKELRMLQFLVENKSHFVTSKELAAYLDCSDRTIRTYYKAIVDELKTAYNGVNILSKSGVGYQLVIDNEVAYARLLEENHITESGVYYSESVDINDRYNYLLNKLLFEQGEIYFDDLVNELYVSRSTLSADFKKIRHKLAAYHLKIESKANKGVFVIGQERDKRRFIIDHFIDSGFIHTMHSYVGNRLFNQVISFEELTIIILDECREAHLKLSDFAIQNLIIHIALAIRRVTEGFYIMQIDESAQLSHLPESEVATCILNRISAVTQITFPPEEVDYITLHLVSKSYSNPHGHLNSSSDKIRQELLQALHQIGDEIETDFQLIEGLVAHLATLLIRLKNQVVLENPLSSEIQMKYPHMFYLGRRTLDTMPTFNTFTLSDNEIAYIALHFMAAKERKKRKSKFNILVICATGYGSAQMLKSRISNELGNLVHIVDVIGYYEMTDEKLHGIDFIISSIDLSRLIFNIPIFTVSVFFKEEEVQAVRHKIAYLEKSKEDTLENADKKIIDDIESHFDAYFSENYFLCLDKADKDTVIEYLLEKMGKGEGEQFIDRMKKMLSQRESMSSVIFSDSIAVPHPIKAVANQHHIGVAIIKEGLKWNDDYPHIQFVFLPSMSIYDNDGLPELASCIVDLVDRPDIQKQLLESQTFQQFKTLFLKIKERKLH